MEKLWIPPRNYAIVKRMHCIDKKGLSVYGVSGMLLGINLIHSVQYPNTFS
jgi:hypothetical protein